MDKDRGKKPESVYSVLYVFRRIAQGRVLTDHLFIEGKNLPLERERGGSVQ